MSAGWLMHLCTDRDPWPQEVRQGGGQDFLHKTFWPDSQKYISKLFYFDIAYCITIQPNAQLYCL